jgi:hypothetical protein
MEEFMNSTEIEPIPLRVPYEERIRRNFYPFGMTELVLISKRN